MIRTENYIRYQQVDSVERSERGLLARLHGELLSVDVVQPDVVRIAISRAGVFDANPTYAVCVDPFAEQVAFETEIGPDVARVATTAMTVVLGLRPFRLDVFRADGSVVVQTAEDEHGQPWTYATLNDRFTLRRTCRQEDAIYGLGEKGGRLNRKGRDFTLWNTDVLSPDASEEFAAAYPQGHPRADRTSVEFDPYYVSIPLYYHLDDRGGAVAASFVDNGYRAFYDFTATDEYRIHFDGGQYTEYLFAGPSMPDILRRYTWLTGRMAPPPIWALGYHQCRWFVYTQDAVEAVAQRHRDDDIPCDAVWLDIEYMDGYRVFTWDPDRFPDPQAMLKRLSDNGFRTITIIDPGVKWDPGYAVFDAARERDVLCRTESGDLYIGQVWPGNTAFPDFVTEEARTWWGELNAEHVRSGLAGVWNDMNEPATGDIAPERMLFGRGEFSHERYHNQYALLMAMGTTEGLRAALPELRTFVLSRAGFAGIQRYAANWMGDNQSRWDHLGVSMPMAAGFGLSGQPFVGADIGGFQGNSNAELFLRWMQYGVLTPFCRNHSELDNVDQYAWAFGPVVEDLVRDAVRLRYRLMPYLYACFLLAAETGAPVQRPLVFDHQDDPTVRDLDDEFLLGPDLLVAPVTEPGQTARQVYLPAGGWYDWHTRELLPGNRFHLARTPMEGIPLYARAGAVLPLWPTAPASTMDHHPSTIELLLFVPGADGRFTSLLQEDDGVTVAAVGGARYRTTFELVRSGGRIRLTGEVDGDGYPEFAREAFVVSVIGAEPHDLMVDGRPQPAGTPIRIANAGRGFSLTFGV